MQRRFLTALTATMLLAGGVTATHGLASTSTARGILVRAGTRSAIVHKDGNDTKGPLDLGVVRVGSAGSTGQVFTIGTLAPFTNADIGPSGKKLGGNFYVGFDLNDDEKTDYGLYLFYSHGLRGELLQGSDVITRKIHVTRPSTRSIRATVRTRLIGRPENYRFLVASRDITGVGCSQAKPCVDAIPNKYPLILSDLTPPEITTSFPAIAPDTTYLVSFTVGDVGDGSGIKSWTLQENVAGVWQAVESGTTEGPQTVSVPSAEGNFDQLRVRAKDRAGHKTTSDAVTVPVPFDDIRQGTVVYATQITNWRKPLIPGAFKGSSHVALMAGSTATFTFTGSQLCVIGGPTPLGAGSAQFVVDGGAPITLSGEDQSTAPLTEIGCLLATPGDHTVDITTGDTFNFDGYIATP
jgi:hypothetical protein